MNRLAGVLAALLLAPVAGAHAPIAAELTCALCNEAFIDFQVGTYSISGTGDELRPMTYIPAGEFTFLTCPKCYYSNLGRGFGRREGRKVLQAVVTNAPAVRKALAATDTSAMRRPAPLLLERIRLTEICHRAEGKSARERRYVCVLGAWAADDAGEDELAREYRKKVIALTDAVLRHAKSDEYVHPWVVRFQRAAMRKTLGQEAEAVAGFVRLERQLGPHIEALAARFRREGKRVAPRPKEDWFLGEEKYKYAELLGELRFLAHRSRVEHLKVSYRQRGQAKALAEARKAGKAERLAFLEVFAKCPSGPTVAFLRQLIKRKRPAAKEPPGLLDDDLRLDDAEEEEDPDREAYLYAIWRGQGYPCNWWQFREIYRPGRPLDAEAKAMASAQGLKRLADALAKLAPRDIAPLPARELTRPWFPQPVPRHEAAQVKDSYLDRSDRDRGLEHTIVLLCWRGDREAARLLLADLRRRPNYYLHLHFGKPLYGDHLPYDGSGRTSFGLPRPEELIALLGPETTAHATEQLGLLKQGKVALPSALAGLCPLAYLRDDRSRQLLRDAVASRHVPLRLLAAWALLRRRDPLGKDVLLAESVRRGKPGRVSPDLQDKLFSLLEKADVRHLRALRSHKPPAPWILAGLAELNAPGAVRDYDAFAKASDARVGGVWHDFGSHRVLHTPASVRDEVLSEAMGKAREYCTESLADYLIEGSERRYDADGFLCPLVKALASRKVLHDRCRRLCSGLARRPAPLFLKLAMLEALRTVKLPEVESAARAWSRSRNTYLAKKAKEALHARLEE